MQSAKAFPQGSSFGSMGEYFLLKPDNLWCGIPVLGILMK